MPPITKETETPKTPVASSAENGTLLQMPATQRPTAEVGGRVQPVALEVPVSLNGARTVDGSDKREPFSETTKTVLVFGNGAVIRLTSSVAPGQLLFLTNEKTKREVVCQVVKSKNYRNVSGYVELEFTEPAVGFWGVRFPSDRLGPAREVPLAPAASTTPRVLPAAPANLEVEREKPVSALPANQAGTSGGNFSLDSFPFAPPTVAPKVPKTDQAPAAAPAQQDASKSLDEVLAEFAVKPAPQQPTAPEPKLDNARLQDQLSSILFADDQKTNASGASPSADTQAKPLETISALPVDQHLAEKVSNTLQGAAVLPRESKTQNLPQPPANIFSEAQPDEIEIPAWLMPKSNTSQPSNRPQESIAKLELNAATETPLAESSLENFAAAGASVDNNDLSVPNFGSGLTAGFIEDTGSAAGSKKGLWIGIAAAVLILLAGGFWYLQQSGVLAGTVAANSQSIPTKAANARTKNLVEAPQPAPSSLASDIVAKPVKTEVTASAPAIVPPPMRNAVAPTATNNAAISTRDAQPPASQPKKPSLGEMHLAAPVVHAKSASQDGVTAPTLSDSQDLPAAAALSANFTAGGGQPAAPSAPLAIGGNVLPAKLISSVQPSYTAMAKSQHASGDVKIDALIDADGRVTTVKIISGPVLLQQSAIDALRQWKYRPATLNGSPVSMHLTVTLQFRLQ